MVLVRNEQCHSFLNIYNYMLIVIKLHQVIKEAQETKLMPLADCIGVLQTCVKLMHR